MISKKAEYSPGDVINYIFKHNNGLKEELSGTVMRVDFDNSQTNPLIGYTVRRDIHVGNLIEEKVNPKNILGVVEDVGFSS